jgi:hypothetical protein
VEGLLKANADDERFSTVRVTPEGRAHTHAIAEVKA